MSEDSSNSKNQDKNEYFQKIQDSMGKDKKERTEESESSKKEDKVPRFKIDYWSYFKIIIVLIFVI